MKTETNPLKRRRLSFGYSQKQISELMEITQSQYSRIENGSSDPTKYLKKLSDILECDPDEIFKGKKVHVQVEENSDLTRGETVVDWLGVKKLNPNCNVITEADSDRFFKILKKELAKLN